MTSELQKEAEANVERLRKKAAGRVCWESREEREAACQRMIAYYEELIQLNKLANGPVRQLRGRKASDRMPFL
jgi:hypothetical protein